MMHLTFATCNVRTAMEFIRKFYPHLDEEKVPKLAELIRKDILRVTDSSLHGSCEIIRGNRFDSKHDSEISEAIQELQKVIEEVE